MKKIRAFLLAFLLLFSAAAAEESRSLPTINVDAIKAGRVGRWNNLF